MITYTQINSYIYTYIHIYTCTHMYIQTHTYTRVDMYMYMYMFTYVHSLHRDKYRAALARAIFWTGAVQECFAAAAGAPGVS